jgi:hypothetical protein
MSHKSYFPLLLSVFAVLFLAPEARACSCGPKPTVLAAYEEAEVIVIVRAVAVEKAGPEQTAPEGRISDGKTYVDGVKSTTMRVERVFKGKVKAGDEMIFAQGGGADCIWTFSEQAVGHQFLFYLTPPEGGRKVWVGFGCGRSNGLKYAGDDLLYLNKLDKVRGRTRLSGTVEFEGGEGLSGGRSLRVVGEKKTYNVKTDANGVYEIYDLPAGKYEVVPEVPAGWKVNDFRFFYSPSVDRGEEPGARRTNGGIPVVVEDKKHASLDIHFDIDNAIRGKVLDAGGRPLKGVCITASPAGEKEIRGEFDCTEDDGGFAITELAPGNYILVANDENKITSSEPFPTLYYPNVFEREKAGVITIRAGDHLENFDIYVPKAEETVTVEGVFLYSDGKPVVGESVEFKAEKTGANVEGDAREQTDAKGRFRLKILKGLRGELFGEMYAYIGEFENCPKLEAVIKKDGGGGSGATINTPALKIRADADLFNVELKYPFPGCRKAK